MSDDKKAIHIIKFLLEIKPFLSLKYRSDTEIQHLKDLTTEFSDEKCLDWIIQQVHLLVSVLEGTLTGNITCYYCLGVAGIIY